MKKLIPLLIIFASCQKTEQYGSIAFTVKVFLQGPYDSTTNRMRKDWNQYGLLRTHQPFNVAPWFYPGQEYVNNSNGEIVDWILIELWTRNLVSVAKSACLLLSDGSVIDYNGRPYVTMSPASEDSVFHIVIRHVNHLAVRTRQPIRFNEWIPQRPVVNLTFASENVYQSETYTSTQQVGAVFCMRAGDANANGIISRSGPGNDDLVIKQKLGSFGLYTSADCNMDARVDSADLKLLERNANGSLGGWVYKAQL